MQIYCCDGTAAEVLLALPGVAVESKTNFQKGTKKYFGWYRILP